MSAYISMLELWAGNLILIGLGFFCLRTVVLWVFFPDRDWKRWMTLEEYWAANPNCKTNDGSKCYKCGSRNIRQFGYKSSDDPHRIHQCNQCNSGLYRT